MITKTSTHQKDDIRDSNASRRCYHAAIN